MVVITYINFLSLASLLGLNWLPNFVSIGMCLNKQSFLTLFWTIPGGQIFQIFCEYTENLLTVCCGTKDNLYKDPICGLSYDFLALSAQKLNQVS